MNKIIGVVGGMGTYAGIDLLKKIADNTVAGTDQEHLPVVMISLPHKIPDRSEYLFEEVDVNPGYAISDVVTSLAESGAKYIGLPCNTAHVPEILSIVDNRMPEGCRLINMIDEVAGFISANYPGVRVAGVLGTNGVFKTRVYDRALGLNGITSLYPNQRTQFELMHPAIYNDIYGIKAFSNPVTPKAIDNLKKVAQVLIDSGAEVLILACTEIPLAIEDSMINGVPVVDANDILAKALVREVNKR